MTENNGTTKVSLTRRGQIVVGLLVATLAIATLMLVETLTTPAKCKVPADKMSQGCVSLVYPHN